jgi:hypothetical protein
LKSLFIQNIPFIFVSTKLVNYLNVNKEKVSEETDWKSKSPINNDVCNASVSEKLILFFLFTNY